MKEPKVSNLKYDAKGTKTIRDSMAKSKKIKITINIDADSLQHLKDMADRRGGSYQKLLNQILRESIEQDSKSEDRLSRLEKEIEKIKRKLAA